MPEWLYLDDILVNEDQHRFSKLCRIMVKASSRRAANRYRPARLGYVRYQVIWEEIDRYSERISTIRPEFLRFNDNGQEPFIGIRDLSIRLVYQWAHFHGKTTALHVSYPGNAPSLYIYWNV